MHDAGRRSSSPQPPSLPWRAYLAARSTLFVVPWLTHVFVADALLSLLLPVSAVFPDQAQNLASRLAESVWRGVQFIFTRLNRAEIVVSGADALPEGESAIVVANHVEWTDFYLLQELALKAGMLSRCRWFAKQQLKWVPFLGWGLWAMGMPLVSRKWTEDQREMNRVFKGVLQRKWPIWLISYSEATRYTASKRQQAEKWCKANSKRLGKHVLYPRTKGFIASVQKLRTAPHVKAVYDVTIAYAHKGRVFMSPPTFVQTMLNPRLDKEWRFYVHVDRFPLTELPTTDEGLASWLEDRWVQKGERLEELKLQLEKGQSWDEQSN